MDETLTLWAEAVNPASGSPFVGVKLRFYEDNAPIGQELQTGGNGEVSMTHPYPSSGVHTYMVMVVPGQSVDNKQVRPIISQPVTLKVGSNTTITLEISRVKDSTEHRIGGWLKSGSSVLPSFQPITIKVNETVYSALTGWGGYFKLEKPLNLQPLNDKATAYTVMAIFNGSNPRSATKNATAPDGQTYPVCTTIQYDYKPSTNYVSLIIEPLATSGIASSDATTTQNTESTTATVQPAKTPEQMQAEAEQSGWLTIWHEFSWWYPWYRIHYVSLYSGSREFDLGMSPLPFADTLQYAESLMPRISQFLQKVIWSIAGAIVGAEFTALITSEVGGPVAFFSALGFSLGTKLAVLYANWNSIDGLISAYIGSLFSTVLGLLKMSFKLVMDFIKLVLGIISLAEFGLGKLYSIISVPINNSLSGDHSAKITLSGSIAMIKSGSPPFQRAVGLLLIVIGFPTLYFVTPIVLSVSLLATWILVWFIVSTVGLGAFFISGLELRYSLKSLLIALAILLLWSIIFFIPLPGNSQYLLAVFAALIGVLIYRYYYERKPKIPTKLNQFSKKIGGALLVMAGVLALYVIFPSATAISLLVAWLVSLPIFFTVFLGCSLILERKTRSSMEWWLVFMLVTSLPWITTIPFIYQILFLGLLLTAALSAILWYRRRNRSLRAGNEKR